MSNTFQAVTGTAKAETASAYTQCFLSQALAQNHAAGFLNASPRAVQRIVGAHHLFGVLGVMTSYQI